MSPKPLSSLLAARRAAELRLTAAVDRVAAESLERAEFAKLGARQRAILADTLEQLFRGAGDQVRWLPRPRSQADAKALSRALRDLERRGLLVRVARDGEPGLPTHWIRITRAGIAAAQHVERIPRDTEREAA